MQAVTESEAPKKKEKAASKVSKVMFSLVILQNEYLQSVSSVVFHCFFKKILKKKTAAGSKKGKGKAAEDESMFVGGFEDD